MRWGRLIAGIIIYVILATVIPYLRPWAVAHSIWVFTYTLWDGTHQ